jgi:hypothetical protein
LPLIVSADLDALTQPDTAGLGQFQPRRREVSRVGRDDGGLRIDVEVASHLEGPQRM